MVTTLTGWLDYDRPHLPALAPPERVDYFEKRVRLVAINPLRRVLENEILQAGGQSSALLIFAVSICCAIEAAGFFLIARPSDNKQRFDAFLAKYMSPEFQTGKVGKLTYGEILRRHFRNGLAPGFAVCHGGFEGLKPGPYFMVRKIAGHDCLEINPTLFLDDYVAGVERYLADLRSANSGNALLLKLNEVFEEVFIRGDCRP
jgi:hypothetical protein